MNPNALLPKGFLALIAEFVVFAALLFVSVGTVLWPAGWVFVAIFLGYALVILRRSPRRWRRLAPWRERPS